MAEAWNQLGDEYQASSSVLIGDADCTGSASELCEKYEVQGYPTIKYFVDGDMKGQDYQGGRDFDSLKSHVVDNLERKCDINDASNCSDKEKAYIKKMTTKPSEEREKALERLVKMKDNPMKAELKQWLFQRMNILKALGGNSAEGEL